MKISYLTAVQCGIFCPCGTFSVPNFFKPFLLPLAFKRLLKSIVLVKLLKCHFSR